MWRCEDAEKEERRLVLFGDARDAKKRIRKEGKVERGFKRVVRREEVRETSTGSVSECVSSF